LAAEAGAIILIERSAGVGDTVIGMRRNGLGRAGIRAIVQAAGRALILPCCLAPSLGCESGPEKARWKDWEYSQEDARDTQAQVASQTGLQKDSSALTAPVEAVPGEIPSNTMTEQQRRAIQEEYARMLRERAEEQARAASASGQQGKDGGVQDGSKRAKP